MRGQHPTAGKQSNDGRSAPVGHSSVMRAGTRRPWTLGAWQDEPLPVTAADGEPLGDCEDGL